MSYLGSIRFRLFIKEGRVDTVEIAPSKELKIEKLLIGKTPEEAFDFIPALFALCPSSQLAAARLACAVALNHDVDQNLVAECRFANHLEIINEGVRFFLLQCASPSYRIAKTNAYIEMHQLCETLKKLPFGETKKRLELWEKLRSLVSFLLLDGFSLDWQQDLYNGTIIAKQDSLSAFFDEISHTQRTVGWCPAPLLNKAPTYVLNALKEKGCWKNKPWRISLNDVTGPVERLSHNPVVLGLLSQDGNTNYTRIVARFIEVLASADLIRIPSETLSAMELSKHTGVALVENSRGILIHTAQISPDTRRIEDYNILTPTEINVVHAAWFKDTLKGLKFKTAEELKQAAAFTILSFDPCTQFEVEVIDA